MDKELWDQCREFHGHECPGLAIGFRAALLAMEKLGGAQRAGDEQLVCVTENDACGVDAVQVLTGCTMGKGNLLYRPTGKMAFSFFLRESGESVRIVLKPDAKTEEMNREQWQEHLLEAPADVLFRIKKPSYGLPESARIFASVVCEECGESAPEHKIRLQDGKKVCLDCFSSYDRGW